VLHEGEGILLIYDNAIDTESLKPYLPQGGGAQVLVTSNAHAWRAVATPLEIGLWPKEIGADYLIARTGRAAERTAAEELSEALGGLPLAHEQAAAYCERLGISLMGYRKRFEAAPTELLNDARSAPAEYHQGLTVAKTFALAIDEAAKLNCLAEPLIVHAALLAPEPIPLFLFSEAREKFGEPLASVMGDDLDEAVAALRSFSLLDREELMDEPDASITTDAIRLHRLVREVAAARRDGDARVQLRCSCIAALELVYPADGFNNPASWPRCALLTPHLLTVCDAETTDVGTNAKCADLLQRAASFFYGRAAYSQARPLFERVVAARGKALGPEHPYTAHSLNNLAVLLKDQGDLAGARALFERALAIWEKVGGPAHPDTAASLNNLASQLQAEGDLLGARPLFERALAIWEKALGPVHPDTATGLSNLAFVLQAQGDLSGARPLFERALAIYEKILGPEQSHTASSLNNLARLLELEGDLSGANPLFERALAIYEKVLGSEHPNTNRVRHNLARLLLANGKAAKAANVPDGRSRSPRKNSGKR
jgi:tetratricopeptide (TPR) repeat protein